ncbi:MAG: hypothetical protein J0M29_06685 [Chitinophagales bacterium]|nr:hypothetical protein [Chitinophagales bacterium]
MKKTIILPLLWFATTKLWSQTDSIPTPATDSVQVLSKAQKIADSRQELISSFLLDDPAGAGLWMDSLTRLEDAQYAGLIWDERWLLYYWTESYGTLLAEVTTFNEDERALQSWKIQPPKDSLFDYIDIALNERKYDIFGSIRTAFLNEEEKAFTTLLLEYLLRMNHDEEEWASRLQSFEVHYPASRFKPFVHSIKPAIMKPSKHALGISGGFCLGNWSDQLERNLGIPYAMQFDLYYWTKRWNVLFDATFAGPYIRRDIVSNGDIWPKDDPTTFVSLGLNLGYDLINRPKIRVFPSVGAGLGILKPTEPDEDEEPLPLYYDNFYFTEFHLAAALTADVKLFTKDNRDWNTPKGSYHGIRLKLGWNGLNFGNRNEYLRGELFYLAVHYNLFGVLPKSNP